MSMLKNLKEAEVWKAKSRRKVDETFQMFEVYFKVLTSFFKHPVSLPDILSIHWNDRLRNHEKQKGQNVIRHLNLYFSVC